MKKTEKRRRPEGSGWDDAPRRAGARERFVEKRQQWEDYLDTSPDDDGLDHDGLDDGGLDDGEVGEEGTEDSGEKT